MPAWTFTHSPTSNGARSLCILQVGRTWRVVSCNPGHEQAALTVLLERENLL
jgi:hypothetical protein